MESIQRITTSCSDIHVSTVGKINRKDTSQDYQIHYHVELANDSRF